MTMTIKSAADIAAMRVAGRLASEVLGVSLDELMAEGAHAPRKRGPVPQIQQHMERISLLPKPKQQAVMDVIEAMLAQQSR